MWLTVSKNKIIIILKCTGKDRTHLLKNSLFMNINHVVVSLSFTASWSSTKFVNRKDKIHLSKDPHSLECHDHELTTVNILKLKCKKKIEHTCEKITLYHLLERRKTLILECTKKIEHTCACSLQCLKNPIQHWSAPKQ